MTAQADPEELDAEALQAHPLESADVPEEQPRDESIATAETMAGDRTTQEPQPAEASVIEAAEREAPLEAAQEGPPLQWAQPTQPNHSRPHAAPRAQRDVAPVAEQRVEQSMSSNSPQWPSQPPPQVQWPQQYPQFQVPQQPAQAPYPPAYPQGYPQGVAQGYPPLPQQPYPVYQQPGSSLPQPAQPQVQYPYPYPTQVPQVASGQASQWPGGYAQAATPQAWGAQTAVVAAMPPASAMLPSWETPEKPKQAFIWRAIKWPIKTLLKALYLTGSAARQHRAAALVLVLVVALLAGGGYAVYQYTHSALPDASNAIGGSAGGQVDNTPFTIVTGSQPPLASGVITWLHAYKAFDGYELWSSLSPALQKQLTANGLTAQQLNSTLQQEKGAGIAYPEFIYTGGFLSPDDTSSFTVEAVESLGSAKAVRTWYFVTDSNDKIIVFQDLTPGAQ